MKIITNPIQNIPKLKNSHVLGWSSVWSDQLQACINHSCDIDIYNAETVYVEHGVNFGGTLNLFGGADKALYDKINRLATCKNIISLDIEMPDYGEQLSKRIGASSTYEKIDQRWTDALRQRFKNIPVLKQSDLFEVCTQLDGVTFGDSHSPSYSRLTDVVYRKNGRTLYGCLKRGLINELEDAPLKGTVTFCLGSIDIRHHMLRHESFDLDALLTEYVKQGDEIGVKYGCEVYYAAPVPIEYEGRKLPKTGYYKGTPFYGSRDQRLELTHRFIDTLNKKCGGRIVSPPDSWYTMDGEKYAKTFMENSSSVHISPEYYRRKDWGQTCLM